MEPIGTITMYFPFLDSDTNDLLLTIMENSSDYRDFVQTLVTTVCDTESNELTAFSATRHAVMLADFNCLQKIAEKYGNHILIRPNLFIASGVQGNHEDLIKAREAVDQVLENDLPKWLQLEMYITKLEAEVFAHPKSNFDDTTTSMVKEILAENEELNFYVSRFFHALSTLSQIEGDVDEAKRLISGAISNAEEHDNQNRLARLLRTKAKMLQSTDMKQSVELLLKSLEIMEKLGDSEGLGNTIFQLGKIEAIRGEYDQAIEHNLKIVSMRQKVGSNIGPYAITLSTLFNITRDSNASLEWARMAEENTPPTHKPRAVLNQVWALLLQQKVTEALVILDGVRETVFNSGMESHLAAYYLVNGVLEMVEGELSNAAVSFEEALNIYERLEASMSINICTYHLAVIEVLASETMTSDSSGEVGPWLTLLEERAVSEDLPGVLGQALLLKSRLFLFQNKENELKYTIHQLSALIEEHNLQFLQSSLDKLIERV